MKKSKKKEIPKTIDNKSTSLPSAAHAIASIGKESEKLILAFYSTYPESSLFEADLEISLNSLVGAFKSGQWSDIEAAKVLKECLETARYGQKIDIISLNRWILSHSNDAQAVLDCLSIVPPEEIDIIKVLSRSGSQKLVFLATWRLTQRQVVLKKLTGPPEVADKIMARELQPHPLSMQHLNIIKTHKLNNKEGEPFLVEERLPVVLNDQWSSEGVQEAANLFYDIASALQFLCSKNLVHGDVKPDNIGSNGEDYILLDFGICRRKEDFVEETTATGSLRTRAPELLERDRYLEEPEKVDVWALGATVYNAIVGRFPLFDKGEPVPRISYPEERAKFELLLVNRVKTEWERRVDLSLVPSPIRGLLSGALEKDPKKRSSASGLVKMAESQLVAFLRTPTMIGKFSPSEELQQLKNYLPDNHEILKLMPITQKHALQERLETLKETHGFSGKQKEEVNNLLSRLD